MDPLGGDGSGDGKMERREAARSRNRGLWTSSTQESSALRRPHHVTTGVHTTASMESKEEQNKLNKIDDDIVQKSKLSVNAKVFVPKSYSIKQPTQYESSARVSSMSSVQGRIQLARETSLQADMMQQAQNSQHEAVDIQDHGNLFGGSGDYKDKHQESSGDEDNYLIEFTNVMQNLMSVIQTLILNPGRFTSIVPPLINNLRSYLEFPSQFREILKIIIQQSINEDNFRYSGARLCTYLDNGMKPVEQTSFRESLYILCKHEMESQASSWKQKDDHTEEEQRRCHGLILFLAELVTQMEHTSAFDLGGLLIQLIIVVLKKPALNSVKYICQALKLAGHTLEKGKGRSRKEMENMMRSLTELVTTGRVDSHVRRMVHSVHELRNGNWGQTSADSTVESLEPVNLNQAVDEPVFYGPDGKVLTAEENKFLEDVADSATNIENHVILEHGYEDEKWLSEEDDEIGDAYEEFLKNIPK
ncbi:polyadenylate-binding protein-interacting protein 1 isoform X2 [Calliopsis andreniformis]|uniref:polyadenylate-binding protein-interacting protein 1 isoform X2 n=1 Tax=Calliopsis andreniformis TaxID=337506 RepID=UPI003FCD8F07